MKLSKKNKSNNKLRSKLRSKKNSKFLKGGFFLNDNSKGYFKDLVYNHIYTNLNDYHTYIENPNLIGENFKDKDTSDWMKKTAQQSIMTILRDKSYNTIYKNLVRKYTNDKKYYQVFKNKHGVVLFNSNRYQVKDDYVSTKVSDYHINFGALIFTSFLLEYELFLLSSVNGYNYNDGINDILVNTNCKCIFCHSDHCSIYRVYRNTLINNISDILNMFCQKLDALFNGFMNYFIKNYSETYGISEEEVKNCIVPIDHYEHKKGEFDFIYVNWKNRLRNLKRGSVGSTMTQMNDLVHICLKQFSEGYQGQYIAEATGFFSFIYLTFPHVDSEFFGSCITWSMIEMYIMSRLHINGKNINLVLESELDPGVEHSYWKFCQTSIKKDAKHICTDVYGNKMLGTPITHWCTKFIQQSKIYKCRSGIGIPGFNFHQTNVLNFESDKKDVFRALIYPILDSYFKYFNDQCRGIYDVTPESEAFKNEILYELIYEKFQMFEELLG